MVTMVFQNLFRAPYRDSTAEVSGLEIRHPVKTGQGYFMLLIPLRAGLGLASAGMRTKNQTLRNHQEDDLVKSQRDDGFVKSSRCQARKN
jgi:hypothetical protein